MIPENSNQLMTDSPIALIRELRDGTCLQTVSVSYRGKWVGDYVITYTYNATLKLSNIDKNASKQPLYIPNPIAVPASFECSADGRTFVSIIEDSIPIYSLTFIPLIP